MLWGLEGRRSLTHLRALGKVTWRERGGWVLQEWKDWARALLAVDSLRSITEEETRGFFREH